MSFHVDLQKTCCLLEIHSFGKSRFLCNVYWKGFCFEECYDSRPSSTVVPFRCSCVLAGFKCSIRIVSAGLIGLSFRDFWNIKWPIVLKAPRPPNTHSQTSKPSVKPSPIKEVWVQLCHKCISEVLVSTSQAQINKPYLKLSLLSSINAKAQGLFIAWPHRRPGRCLTGTVVLFQTKEPGMVYPHAERRHRGSLCVLTSAHLPCTIQRNIISFNL